MHLTAIFAQLCCRDLEVGIAWFSALFARPPDARPMDGLAEWHHGAEAGLQLRLAPDHAGHGTLTLIVPHLAAQRERLQQSAMDPGGIEDVEAGRILRLADPDENLVVLVQPRSD